MIETKQKILDAALELYNNYGAANVSIRQIAQMVQISHSNLIYHFPTHQNIILALHESLLKKATHINQGLDLKDFSLLDFYHATKIGFSVVYEYRFLFNDLLWICNTFPNIRQIMINVEKIRSAMYQELISVLIARNLMRQAEFDDEYNQLIILIKIFSDHWFVSSSIYDVLSNEERIEKYAYLLMTHFYPYFTVTGKEEFKIFQIAKKNQSDLANFSVLPEAKENADDNG
ncbi:MAG TPA: hypothetical protein DCX89_07530 [Saprospirales bacterium]|nr:hypothetical protein [Saprospirales bacterium]HRQ30318.1 TetR/AcrR family transcriptional regulator [Saprospiraceae bacterium]